LYKVATAKGGGQMKKSRVVLLARREADWWRILREDDADVAQLVDASPGVRRLEALTTGRAEAFAAAARAFAEEDGGKVGVPKLERKGLDRVLYLHMAALAAVGGERIEEAGDALAKTLEHERRFWTRRVETFVTDEAQQHLLRRAVPRAVAALTLTGGAAGDGVARLVDAAAEGLALRHDVRATLDELVLRPLYGDGTRLGALEPDLLGEELVASCLAADQCDRRDYWMSVPLREIACEATRRRQEVCQESWPEPDEEQLRELSRTALHLGNRLSLMGRREEALEVSEEAVRVLAPFFERLPEAFAGWMRVFVSNYQKLAAGAGRPVDGELLGPILAALERLGEDG
jgi:hypothetical protein